MLGQYLVISTPPNPFPVDEVVFDFQPYENSFLRGFQKCVWMKCFIGIALAKFGNFQKTLGKIAMNDINFMFFSLRIPVDEANFPRHP